MSIGGYPATYYQLLEIAQGILEGAQNLTSYSFCVFRKKQQARADSTRTKVYKKESYAVDYADQVPRCNEFNVRKPTDLYATGDT